MDLPPLQKQVLESIVAQSTRSNGTLDLQQLVSRLPEGAQLQALVQDVQVLDAKTRVQLAALLEKLATSGARITNENSSLKNQTPSSQVTNQHSPENKSLNHLLTLVNTANNTNSNTKSTANETQLYAITLKLMGKSALTFSNVSPTLHQRVTLTLAENKQLLIRPSVTTSTTIQNQVKLDASHQHALVTKNEQINILLNKSQATPIISQGLRQYLPQESSISSNLNTLQRLITQLTTQLTSQHAIPKELQEHALIKALSAVLNKPTTLNHTTHASTLRPAIQNSGANLENKLVNLLNQSGNNQSVKLETATSPRSISSNGPPSSIEKDLKAQLLRVLDIIQQTSASPTTSHHHRPLTPSAIDKLLLNLFSPRASTESTQQQLSGQQVTTGIAQLAESIRPNILAAIARIAVYQLRHLSQSINEGSTSPSGAFMELPIKVGEQFIPLILQIQEKPSPFEEKEKDEEKKRKKEKNTLRKRWHIFMEFDLDQYGKFASDIDYCEPQVKTQIWVEHAPFWELTQKHLHELRQELESNGVEVEELTCHKGKIPNKEMKIDQHLVDIRT